MADNHPEGETKQDYASSLAEEVTSELEFERESFGLAEGATMTTLPNSTEDSISVVTSQGQRVPNDSEDEVASDLMFESAEEDEGDEIRTRTAELIVQDSEAGYETLDEEEAMEDGPFTVDSIPSQNEGSTDGMQAPENNLSGREIGEQPDEDTDSGSEDGERPEPALHSYLGHIRDVTIAGNRMIPENIEVELPILLLDGVVLFPGETLPLRLISPSYIELVQRILSTPTFLRDTPVHLGILNQQRGTQDQRVVGTTAEIRSGQLISPSEMVLKCTGRQRFRLIKNLGFHHGAVPYFRVRVMKDFSPVPCHVHLPLPRSFRTSKSHRKFGVAAFPYWVYKLQCPHHLMSQSQELLRTKEAWEGIRSAVLADEIRSDNNRLRRASGDQSEMDGPCEGWPKSEAAASAEYLEEQDPLAFSFWLGANLPLSDVDRQQLLAEDSLLFRLRAEKQHLQTSSEKRLVCAQCNLPMGSKASLFTLSGAEGVVGAYVNPHGVVHQTLTLREMTEPSIRLQGQPTIQDTWFPGYAWTIAYCRRCFSHLGWRFTAVSRRALPQFFWGIRRSALKDEETRSVGNRLETVARFMNFLGTTTLRGAAQDNSDSGNESDSTT